MSRPVLFRRLVIEGFRNLAQVAFDPAPRLNLLCGDNGHGKTSVIEALYVLATTRSFRTKHLGEVVGHGRERARVSARIEALGLERDQSAQLSSRGRSFDISGKHAARHLDYAKETPVIAFHPGDLALVQGPAAGRRTLLARVTLYSDPPGAEAARAYRLATQRRQALLGAGQTQGAELDAFESVMAQNGARAAEAHRRAAALLTEAFEANVRRMAPRDLLVSCRYQPAGTEDPDEFRRELTRRRLIDLRRGSATYGPQRDDLLLETDERSAQKHASQGQQRLLALGLKLAELDVVRAATNLEPVLLLDDVSSELDEARTSAVFELLQASQSQIFVTTTRPELFSGVDSGPETRKNFVLRSGHLEAAKKYPAH